MRVLLACEFSGIVRDEFRKRGHTAWSCDLLNTEKPGAHLMGDVLGVIQEGWDLMIAFPPCTYLTYADAQYWKDKKRVKLRDEALEFFMKLYNAPIPKIAIENPRGWPCKQFRKPDQEINPFDFGQPVRKRICLWLKNLPLLIPTNPIKVEPSGYCIKKNGRRYNYYYHQGKNSHERSRFFPAVAEAMAEQWGNL